MSAMFDMSRMSAPLHGRGGRLAPAARLLVCAALPWYACVWLGTSTAPVAAALPAVLILRGDVFAAPRLALERLAGVAVGVLLSVAVLHWLPTGPLSFPVLLVCACAGMYLLGRRGSPNQQVLITALVIYSTPVPGYPLARLEESAVGIAVVALLGPLLWPPDPYRETARGLEEYRTGLADRLARTARTNCPPRWSTGPGGCSCCRPGGTRPGRRARSGRGCGWPRGRPRPCSSSPGRWRPGRPPTTRPRARWRR